MIQADGSDTTSSYFTLFGQGGSSQLTSGTTGFDLSIFDAVLQMENIYFAGEITGAVYRSICWRRLKMRV